MAYRPPAAAGYDYAGQYAQPSYANWLYRVGAYLIDDLVALVPLIVVRIVIAVLSAAGSTGSDPIAVVLSTVALLASLAVAIWNLFIRQGRTGQSLGKQALGIRLVSLQTGEPIGALMAFLRQLCHIVDSLACYIGWLWPIWDSRRQTFADKIVAPSS